jgi:4-hydroxy-tetrahydrodipicolinate synthase
LDKKLKLKGLIVPVITPFKENGDLHEETLRQFVKWLIEQGMHGLYPLGACGESPRLTFQEKKMVIDITIDEVKGKIPVLPCTDHGSLRETLELTKYAREAGANGAVIIPPTFMGAKLLNEDILFDYFKTICNQVDIPVMVYDTAYPISLTLMERLAELPNIVALKDSANDFMKIVSEIGLIGEKISIFPGEEHMLLPSLLLGASGMVGSGLNIFPRLMLDIYNDFQNGQLKEALEKHNKLIPLWCFLYDPRHDEHHVVKEALSLIGKPVGAPRKPYFNPPLSSEEKNQLKRLLTLAGLAR